MDIKVTEGRVIVNRVVHHVSSPSIHYFTVDCASKYAEPWPGSSSGPDIPRSYFIALHAVEGTLFTDPTKPQYPSTKIEFHDPNEQDWLIHVDGGRYSFFITLANLRMRMHDELNEVVWDRDTVREDLPDD